MLIYNRPEHTSSDHSGNVASDTQRCMAQIAQESWAPQVISKQSNPPQNSSVFDGNTLDCGIYLQGGVALDNAGLQAYRSGDTKTALNDFALGSLFTSQGLLSSMDTTGAGSTPLECNNNNNNNNNAPSVLSGMNLLQGGVALDNAALKAYQSGDVKTALNDLALGNLFSNRGLLMDANGNNKQPNLPAGIYQGTAADSAPWPGVANSGELPGLPAPAPSAQPDRFPFPADPLPTDQPAAPHRGAQPTRHHQGPNAGGIIGGMAGDAAMLPTIAIGGVAQGAGSFVENTGNSVMNAGVDMLGNPATAMLGIPVATVGAAADAGGWALKQVGSGVVAAGDAVVNAAVDIGDAVGDAVGSAFSWL